MTTAEDILRETNADLRRHIVALQLEIAKFEAAILTTNPPVEPKPLPIYRAMKFGAGNHMRIGLIT